MLQRAEQFTSALGQKHSVRPRHLHVNLAGFQAIGVMGSSSRGDPVLQSQAAGAGKGLEERCNLLGCSRVIGNRHRFSIAPCLKRVSPCRTPILPPVIELAADFRTPARPQGWLAVWLLSTA